MNQFSHIMDAHQYVLLGGSEWCAMTGRGRDRKARRARHRTYDSESSIFD